jgi:hypothetical protein
VIVDVLGDFPLIDARPPDMSSQHKVWFAGEKYDLLEPERMPVGQGRSGLRRSRMLSDVSDQCVQEPRHPA